MVTLLPTAYCSELHPLKRLDADPQGNDRAEGPDREADQDGDGEPEAEPAVRERQPGGVGMLLAEEIEVAGDGQGRHDGEDEDQADQQVQGAAESHGDLRRVAFAEV